MTTSLPERGFSCLSERHRVQSSAASFVEVVHLQYPASLQVRIQIINLSVRQQSPQQQ
jgi:hypothetical protein